MLTYLLNMLCGFGLTVLVEGTILFVGLSMLHSRRRRLFAGVWLTACTYPIVWLVIPAFFPPEEDRTRYLIVAETFAPVAECLLFWWVFDRRAAFPAVIRDMVVIVLANLASFSLDLFITLPFS